MKETRTIEIRAAQPEQGNNDELVVEGMPVVFDSPTTIHDPMGQFTEVIQRNALQGVDLNDTRLLYNHDLARIPLAKAPKTMQLSISDQGLHMRAVLPDSEEGRSIYTAVRRADLSGMSFSFTCDPSGSSFDVRSKTRSISKINKIFECSIVPFPAYQTTSVEARNQMDEAVAVEKQRQAAKIKINQLLRKGV